MPANLHPMSKEKIAGWQTRLSAFFLYPARPAVLPAVAIFTVCTIIAVNLDLVGLIIAAATTLTAYKFAFEILRHHADGWQEPPEAMLTVHGWLVFHYLIVLFLAWSIYWLVQHFFGAPAGIMVLAVFSLIQPGYTMVTVIEGSALLALNPVKWFRLMLILGNGYFLLAALLFAAQLLENWLGDYMFQLVPGIIATAFVKIIGLWVLFASAYWMGYLVYQFHRELGYEPNAHHDQAIRGSDRDGMLMQAIDAAIASRDYEACMERMKNESRERVPSTAVHAKFRELLVRKGDAVEIRQHAQTFLHQLLIEKQMARAIALAMQQFAIDPDFAPLDGETADALAREARRTGQTALERKLLLCLLAHFPDETMAGDWAVRLSKIFLQAGEPVTRALELLDAATASTRSENQRQRLKSARDAIVAN